jgi:hypothetical protein
MIEFGGIRDDAAMRVADLALQPEGRPESCQNGVRGMKPVMFGYQRVRASGSAQELARGREALVAFAFREGFALGEVFVEQDLDRPCSALAAMIASARRSGVVAVAVPTAADLGRLPRVQWLMRNRLEREAGVRVLVVPQASRTGEH